MEWLDEEKQNNKLVKNWGGMSKDKHKEGGGISLVWQPPLHRLSSYLLIGKFNCYEFCRKINNNLMILLKF